MINIVTLATTPYTATRGSKPILQSAGRQDQKDSNAGTDVLPLTPESEMLRHPTPYLVLYTRL